MANLKGTSRACRRLFGLTSHDMTNLVYCRRERKRGGELLGGVKGVSGSV